MKALVIDAPGAIARREQRDPVPGRGEVLVRSAFVGLCGTDLEILHGNLEPGWVTYPCVPGHEWSGTVAAIGDRASGLCIGDRVVCEGRIPCNRCVRCQTGATNLCLNYDQLGVHTPRRSGGTGLRPGVRLHRLADDTALDTAVLVEPAASLVRGLERADLKPGETIGIVGIGSLGATGLLLAALRGPRLMCAYGLRLAELELAARLGATVTIDVNECDPVAATQPHCRDGLDVVIETAGAPEAVALATRLARPGGRVVLLGLAGAGREVSIPADRFANKDLTVLGMASYDRAAWVRAVDLVRAGLVDFSPVVGRRFPITEFADAYSVLENGTATGRILLAHATAGS